jgi:hypothetical protein
VFANQSRNNDEYNTDSTPANCTSQASSDWISLSSSSGSLRNDSRIHVSIDLSRVPKDENVTGTIKISAAGESRLVNVQLFNPHPAKPAEISGFVESDGIISIEAEHFSRSVPVHGASWQVISDLGRTGDAVTVFPTTTPAVVPALHNGKAPYLEYPLYLFTAGAIKVTCYLLPTHPVDSAKGLRFAISLDGGEPLTVSADAGVEVSSKQWSLNVLNSATTASAQLNVVTPGKHTLRIWMVDTGVVLDKIVLESGKVRPSYLGPKESKVILPPSRRLLKHAM